MSSNRRSHRAKPVAKVDAPVRSDASGGHPALSFHRKPTHNPFSRLESDFTTSKGNQPTSNRSNPFHPPKAKEATMAHAARTNRKPTAGNRREGDEVKFASRISGVSITYVMLEDNILS
jgi:hypothetical protein